jgi:hypothetical protein
MEIHMFRGNDRRWLDRASVEEGFAGRAPRWQRRTRTQAQSKVSTKLLLHALPEGSWRHIRCRSEGAGACEPLMGARVTGRVAVEDLGLSIDDRKHQGPAADQGKTDLSGVEKLQAEALAQALAPLESCGDLELCRWPHEEARRSCQESRFKRRAFTSSQLEPSSGLRLRSAMARPAALSPRPQDKLCAWAP